MMSMKSVSTIDTDGKNSRNPSICRGCLSIDRNTVSLFFSYSYQGYEELTNIVIKENEPYQSLCWECTSLLNKYIIFREKLLQSHTQLKYAQMRVAEDETFVQDFSFYKSSTLSKCNTAVLSILDSEDHKSIVTAHNDRSSYEYILDVTLKQEIFNDDNEYDFNTEKEILPFNETVLSNKCDDVHTVEKILNEDMNYKAEEESTPLREKQKCNKFELTNKKLHKVNVKKLTRVKTQIKDCSNTKQRGGNFVILDPNKIRTIYFTEAEQQQHMTDKSTDPNFLKLPYKCELCFTGFNYEEKLREHIKEKHVERNSTEKSYKCRLCYFYFNNETALKTHTYRHATVFECVACGLRGWQKAPLIEHYRFMHEGTLAPLICNVCGKSYTKKISFRKHMRNHANEEQVQCDHCNRLYSRKDKLIAHIRRHYENKDTRPFVCHCGHRARTECLLKIHSIKHTEERPHYCVECNQNFKTLHSLDLHLKWSKKHTDIEMFKYGCTKCKRRFAQRIDLTRHIESIHMGMKEHACLLCNKTFHRRDKLAQHVKFTHDGVKREKNHACEVCGKTFEKNNLLINHIRIHTGEKPFACKECTSTFNQKSSLATHVRLVHRKEKRPFRKKCLMEDNNAIEK